MHCRVPQELGKSCCLPRKFGKGKADPKLQAYLARASARWERSPRHTDGYRQSKETKCGETDGRMA